MPWITGYLRVAGSDDGSTAVLLPPRHVLLADPDHFELSDEPEAIVQGTGEAQGIATGVTRLRLRGGGPAAPYVDFAESSEPDNPPTGQLRMWWDATNLWVKDSAGVKTNLV